MIGQYRIILSADTASEVPPRVEYTLPDLGYSLKPVLDTIWVWGEGHQAKMRG